ncbi:MAG: peptidase T [Spirochaetae bacterium HGW-Spirochaetae-7]|jgi:tripeptide aminopeptidase|nr:MAG: peptidase T [Spirochaetae bacterium HGW-Spirochaetae-7]
MKDYTAILARPHTAETIERLVRYARIETTSDRHAGIIPSTPSQWNLARLLVDELSAIGIEDVKIDEHCFVVARVPATPGCENKPAVGFMAHVDTASDVSGADVKPRIVKHYDGKALQLSPGWTLDPADFAELGEYAGDTIIVTDGTTLLGADDKAGVAIVMTALGAILGDESMAHGPLYAIFTPDEETGKGMDGFPIDKVSLDACYTFDGGRGGEIESECFTAYEAKVSFAGKSSHPGYARGVMANAVAMAAGFVSMLPRSESPEATDGWYGYYYAHEIHGGLEAATLDVLLRDYTDEGMARRQATLKAIAATVESQFPGGKVTLDIRKQYLNMKRKLDESPKVLELLYEAARKAGAEPYSKPIRGGTDGARLTEMGVPTPNIFAGMHNFHGRFEWASASEMVLAVDTALELVKLWSKT